MEKIDLFYDKKGDVLYISLGVPQKAISKELDNDVLLRVDPATGRVVGLTILNFAERFSNIDHPQSFPVLAEFATAERIGE